MSQHKTTSLFFVRKQEEPYELDFLHIHISSWATKEQLDLAWKMATIASIEGWALESREEKEESDIAVRIYRSLRFFVDRQGKEKLESNFHPADVATFNSSVLQRG